MTAAESDEPSKHRYAVYFLVRCRRLTLTREQGTKRRASHTAEESACRREASFTVGQDGALSLLCLDPTSDTVEDNHGTPLELPQSFLTRHSSLLVQRCGRPAQGLGWLGIRFLVLEADMPTVCIRFQNIPYAQQDPGLGAWGAIQPSSSHWAMPSVVAMPCHAMPCPDSWQAIDACHLHDDVRLTISMPRTSAVSTLPGLGIS